MTNSVAAQLPDTLKDIALAGMDGNRLECGPPPPVDTPTHRVLYRGLREVGEIVRTHSPYATAWAQTGKAVPYLGTTHADYMS